MSFLVVLALIAGCSNGPAYGDVEGIVTLDDQPVRQGRIHFTPIDGKTPTAATLITDGKFRERVPVGSHKVEIWAPKYPPGYVPRPPVGGTVEEIKVEVSELIPERYNSRSELTLEVKSGANTPKFDLRTKGR